MYGPDRASAGSFARNCLLARRLVERGVRFVQLYHRGWDQHNDLPRRLAASAATPTSLPPPSSTTSSSAACSTTRWSSGAASSAAPSTARARSPTTNYGRDHHPRCFTMWLAGGGIKPGSVIGETDDFCYNIAEDPVHVHDFNATILHCLGIDHKRLTYQVPGPRLPPDGCPRRTHRAGRRLAAQRFHHRLIHGLDP